MTKQHDEKAPLQGSGSGEKAHGAEKGRKFNLRRVLILSAVSFLVILTFTPSAPLVQEGKRVELSQITKAIASGDVTEAWVNENSQRVTVKLRSAKEPVTSAYPLMWQRDLVTKLTESDAKINSIAPRGQNIITSLLFSLIPTVLIIGFLIMFMKRGGGMGGLSGALRGKKPTPVDVPTIRFSDVAGVDEAVDELREVVEYLHDPSRFETTGAKPSRGFLLIGPPGTGKTLLARAVAGEANVPFFAVSGSDFVEVFAGVGASRVRGLFDQAREAGRAILFIDEIDAIGRARGGQGFASGANDEREQTLNQILVELDGFNSSNVIILAATNRPDVLDPALTRPGRFDRKIVVPAPDRKGRQTIMELYARSKPFDLTIDWAGFAKRTPGLTGADIALLINESAMQATREDQPVITAAHIENALATTVLGRERKSAIISERDRRIVAWHEAGHAICALTLENADDPVTISIVPRGGAGGVTWMAGSDHDFMTRSQALARLTVAMGGRAAEERLLDGDFTQGAHGDLQSATGLAREMIARYGMGRRMVAVAENMGIGEDPVNTEAAEMIGAALEAARVNLNKHRVLLEALANALLEEENIGLERLLEITKEAEPRVITARKKWKHLNEDK